MSFIVFSTEGRILMSLTEDRWVQISWETLLILCFFFSCSWKEWVYNQIWSHTVTVWSLWYLWPWTNSRRTLLRSVICLYCHQSGQILHCVLLTHCGQLACLVFLQLIFSRATKSFQFPCFLTSCSTKGSYLASLCYSFSGQHTPLLFQFTHLLHIAGIFCKCRPYGIYYSVTTPPSVWLWSKVCSQMCLTKQIFSNLMRLSDNLITSCPLFLFRERIRKGLEELEGVLPGGDTFMHEGILRVSIGFLLMSYHYTYRDP